MSVQLKAFARAIDSSKIRSYLFGSDDTKDIFNDTVNCVSPGGEIIVFGHGNKIITFTIKWFSSPTNDNIICQTFQTFLSNAIDEAKNEQITSVVCLPIAAIDTKLSTHCSPEWFCIAIGFSNGFVKFYTEDGDLLLSQLFHNSAVLKLRCQSHQPAKINPPTVEQPEEIAILYSKVMCTVVGTIFINSLRSCKNQLAKIQAKCMGDISIPPLTYKKWAFDVQKKINDAAIGPRYDITSFQHIVAANICKGISGDKQNCIPQMTQIIAAGVEPYLAIHYTIGGHAQPTFGNITKAVTNKLKSSIVQTLPCWLSYNLSLNETPDTLEQPEQLGCRFSLNEMECEALKIELSPQLSIGVISDNLEKVTLFEVNAGGIIRTLDGYKDVQFGWLVVNENKSSSSKQALFLVMFIPTREVLEVWSMQNYEKISMSKVSKTGRLFYTNFGLFGALSTSRMNIYNANYRCYFIDETENITEINVPYHCIESCSNSQLSQDMYTFKTFKSLCKGENVDNEILCEEVVKLVNNLITDKVRQQAFDYITTSKHMTQNALVAFLKSFQTNLKERKQRDPQNYDDNLLKNTDNHLKLIIFLKFLSNYQKNHRFQASPLSAEDKIQELCKTLRLTDQDMDRIISLLPIEPKKKTVVMFYDDVKSMNLIELLSYFNTTGEHVSINIDKNVDELCKHIFEPIMHYDNDIGEWNSAWIASGIQLSDMVYLAVKYWLSKPLTLTVVTEMLNFHRVIDTICNSNEIKLDWEVTQDQFSNSSNTFACFTGAIICKTIASSRKTVNVNNEWECISGDDYQWNILIERLEQLCHLNATLKYCSKEPIGTLHCLKYEYSPITLIDLLQLGRGGVSTLVGKWLAGIGLDPTLVIDEYLIDHDEKKTKPLNQKKGVMGIQEGLVINTDTAIEVKALNMAEKEILDTLKRLKTCFPYSLDANTLLSNIFWEYSFAWKNCVADLRPLKTALHVADTLPCLHTRQSMCSLIWSTHISPIFLSAVRLIDRVGKVPKDKLCIQDVGMPDQYIVKFFDLCERFFDIIIKASLSAEEDELAEIKHDFFWENWKTNNQHKLTLVQIALNKPNPDRETLFLSHQFVRTFHILAKFSIHINKPLNSLFDCNVYEIDISNLNQNTFNQEVPRTKIKKSKTNFIINSINAAVGLIQKDCEDGQYEFESKECMFWISKIFQLAFDWQLNLDDLRICQVISLYSKGHDRLAEEIIPVVHNKENLVKHLINVIKHRLQFEVCISNLDFHDKIVHFSPEIVSWLQSPGTIDVEKSLLNETLELVQTVITLLPENDSQHEFVISLMDSLISLINS
ncbi:rab3 GTPase-activating protein non-catalytic subunit isoform X1 [Myzus persicae]|uniref:rab3 GTPase-activating protein non-catalytic subunit isoform X1 n=1 Tax=Myzus persicae TaxID=13164 RepID=UPI000B933B4D|nr:rab3 GTPase-activating protein non-catalytic subunit isoform X1 [Myzus persicae]